MTVIVWDACTGAPFQTLHDPSSSAIVTSICFSPDGLSVAAGRYDWTVDIWDVYSSVLLRRLKGHKKAVRTLCYSPDGSYVASGSLDRTIRLWDSSTGLLIESLVGHVATVSSLCFSTDGASIFSGSLDTTIKIWDLSGVRRH